MDRRTALMGGVSLILTLSAEASRATEAARAEIVLRQGVAINGVAQGGRQPFLPDALVSALTAGPWETPPAGAKVALPGGKERSWEAIEANAEGWFQGRVLGGGAYLATDLALPGEGIYLLVAEGHNLVYVNGELRTGDPYAYGSLKLPVRLRAGKNTFVFSCSRGRLRARLLPLSEPLFLNPDDTTLPDLTSDSEKTLWGAVPIVNGVAQEVRGVRLRAVVEGAGGHREIETALPPLQPLSVRKVGFQFAPPDGLKTETARLRLTLLPPDSSVSASSTPSAASVTLELRRRRPGETYKRTFLSQIDGSVQYYAVRPALKPSPENLLVLTLHGASVEAIGQVDAYGPREDVSLVGPTNRRPFGFDWEDWGRLDALEVLALAEKHLPHDPARVCLTGHSMGGHGTWSLGALFPGRFAAIGPSAGWISFDTYGGRPREAATEETALTPGALVKQAASVYDTLLLSENLKQSPVYVLHGDADDNVPVAQARQMRERLAELKHRDVRWHEEKGAGHWWDNEEAVPGAACVDWGPMFALFQESRRETGPVNGAEELTFITPSPGVTAECRWVRVEQQERSLTPSVVQMVFDPQRGTLRATTRNITRLTLFPARMPFHDRWRRLELDGTAWNLQKAARQKTLLRLQRQGDAWKIVDGSVPASEKRPERSGPFKDAFNHGFVLVYGTGGDAAENAALYARARYDAEVFLYRGNGSPELVADSALDLRQMRDRSLILYGNAKLNRRWSQLLKSAPLRCEPGKITVGEREFAGDNLACLYLYPRPGSESALIGAVGGTGLPGLRLTERIPYFVSGVGLPDWVVFDGGVYTAGADAVLAAGYFGRDWKLDPAQMAILLRDRASVSSVDFARERVYNTSGI